MNTIKTSPHFVRKQLLRDASLYVESVGKADIDTLSDVADAPNGKGTILRLVMGATTEMPLRALSYVDSALQIAKTLPCEQLQIVHATQLGAAVNNINLQKAQDEASLLALIVQRQAQATAPGALFSILHAVDKPIDLTPFIAASEIVFASDPALASKLRGKGAKHGGDACIYAAAHSAFQDTDVLDLTALTSNSPAQVRAERIVSIGCQQERTFYAARMALRAELSGMPLTPGAQIFTNHISPPYFTARDGEQTLRDALTNGVDLTKTMDRAARRDLTHLTKNILGEIA